MKELAILRVTQESLAITYESSLEVTAEEIASLTSPADNDYFSLDKLKTLEHRLTTFHNEHRVRRSTSRIIESLNFVEIKYRSNGISEAEGFTNAWLFDRTKTGFVDWLESGRGIYWITGKVRPHTLVAIK